MSIICLPLPINPILSWLQVALRPYTALYHLWVLNINFSIFSLLCLVSSMISIYFLCEFMCDLQTVFSSLLLDSFHHTIIIYCHYTKFLIDYFWYSSYSCIFYSFVNIFFLHIVRYRLLFVLITSLLYLCFCLVFVRSTRWLLPFYSTEIQEASNFYHY